MAPPLIPFGPEGLAALYDTGKRVLIVSALGEIGSNWVLPSLVRDPNFVGGLKFLLQGYVDFPPVDTPPTQPLNINTKVNISLPQEHFNSASVIVQTGSGTYTIDIRYTGLLPPPPKDETTTTNIVKPPVSDVLPPINRYLPGGETLTITSEIPAKAAPPAISSVNLHFNPNYFELVSSSIVNGTINWTLKWAKIPVGKANPQLVEVETDTGIQLPATNLGPPTLITKTIQGYIVTATVLAPGPEYDEENGETSA